MSTRSTINFCHGKNIVAKIYKHCDGYPDGPHGNYATLHRFFAEVKKQTSDTRFSDPSYLAAKFVVWLAGEYAQDRVQKPLAFLSVGILTEDAGDTEYTYFVDCDDLIGDDRFPSVSHREL